MAATESKKIWQLERETELRCEVREGENLSIKLTEGIGEIFGIEMAQHKEYQFTDENFAVFTWYGCTLEAVISTKNFGGVTGSSCYKADSTPNISYVNTHSQLEARRDVALANQEYGPRVLVVGDVDHGKSTTSRMLVAYAARLDRTPIYVDLDVGQSSLSIAGTVSAIQVDKGSINVEEGFPHAMPLVYFFGNSSPKDNIPLYKLYVDMLADHVKTRMDNDLDAKSSGLIINTCGWVDGPEAYDILMHIVKAFNVDVILVMNHDKLYSSLISLMSDGMTVVKLPTSGGIVRRDQVVRRRQRKNRVKEYFYGKPSNPLAPARIELKLSSVKFLRAGGYLLSEGMRSLGDDGNPSPTELMTISPTVDLLSRVLGVLTPLESSIGSSGHSLDDQLPSELIKANIAGFIVVLQIDVEQNSMAILSPCPGALPSNYLIVGSITWVEK